ncbi:microtubule-associated protein 70-2-like protein [Tanacetum coccineum]|uniref:Microtubule-associated protein 70-2-like protein n=1 Tax=Tanacetum coccineum TaxID=301880 RepID=A0ABQ5EWD8_9ASTR
MEDDTPDMLYNGSGGGGGGNVRPPVVSSRRRSSRRPSLDTDDFMNLLHGSDPVKLELNRLENEVRDKDRELSEAQAEIKALRLSERLREKAVEEGSCFLELVLSSINLRLAPVRLNSPFGLMVAVEVRMTSSRKQDPPF